MWHLGFAVIPQYIFMAISGMELVIQNPWIMLLPTADEINM